MGSFVCREIGGEGMNKEAVKKALNEEVISTAEAVGLLNCTRQYIHKLVKAGKLEPIRVLDRDRLFWREDILERLKK